MGEGGQGATGAASPPFSSKVRTRLRHMLYALLGADNQPEMYQLALEPSDQEFIDRLNTRTAALVEERAGLRAWRGVIVLSSALIPLGFLFFAPEWNDGGFSLSDWDLRLAGCLGFLEFFVLISLLFVRARVASIGVQLTILEYEKVLVSIDGRHEKRAAELFFKNQAELKAYYDQTLRQNRQAFIVGILCIGFGLAATITVAALLLDNGQSSTTAKLVAGGLGILSVLLTGFVARIFLHVYEGSAEALGSFHERLVLTNDYHFASLLIAMIEPKEMRMDSQAKLASAISAPRVSAGTKD